MKKNIYILVILLFVFSVTKIYSQCTNCATNYPSATQTITTGTTITVATCAYGGDYANYNVVAGNTYTWATCGDTDFDTQLTLSQGTCGSGTVLGYNDDGCGSQSTISWTATFTGTVAVLVSQYNCTSNSTCMTVTWSCGGAPPPPPANNECTAATTAIVNSGNACTSTTPGTVSAATASAQANGCSGTADDDVWFKFQAVGTTQNIALNNLAGSTTDMYFSVYGGSCAAPGAALLCSDPESGSVSGLTIGTWYWVRVFTWTSTTGQTSTFNLCITTPVPAANNECTTAISVAVNTANACTSQTSGTLLGATASAQANGCFGTADDDVWFSFVATSTAQNIALNNVAGSTTDLYHSVYAGSCAAPGAALVCSDPNNSTVTGLTVGQTYYVRVFSYTSTAGQTSTFDLCITTPPPLPSCSGNPPAGNTACLATPICDLNGYCGSTAATYTADYWAQLNNSCGSIENNSFISFVASSSSISFNVWVTSSTMGYGIQIFIFSAASCNSGSVTPFTCWNPGTAPFGPTVVSATGLTPGASYYIMIDGNAGDVCNYVIGANTGIQIPVDVTPATSTICVGQSVSLTASGGNGTYTWSPSTGLSATTGTTVTATPPAVGTITYTVTSTTGNPLCPSSTTATAVLTVNNCSCTVTAANTGPICASGTFNLTASNVTGATGYSWTGPSGYTSTAQNPTGITASATGGTYTYTVTVTTATSTCTATTTVTVKPKPVITAPANISVCAGVAVAVSAFVSVPVGATYTWTNSNTAIGLAASGTGQVPSFTSTNASASPITGTITVTPTLTGCVGTAITYSITVNPQPTSTYTQTANVCLTGNSFTFTNTGLYGSTYSWTFANGTPGTSTALSPSGVSFAPAGGPYTVTHVVTGSGGCTSTTTSTVTIFPMPVVTVTPSFSICVGAGAANNLTAAGASTYSWAPSTGLSATTGATVTGNPAATTTYTVTGTSANGCTGTATVTITVNPLPTITVPPLTICAGLSGMLTASGASTYSWAPATGLSATSGTSVTASPAATTTYTVTGTSAAGCVNTKTVVVTVNPLPTISVPPISICAGLSGTLTASGASTYTWAPATGLSATTGTTVTANPAATTTYTITGTSAAGCVNTTTVIVTVKPLPTISVPPIAICAGLSGTLTASGASTYTWAPAAGLSATTGTSVTANPAATTTYTVTGTSALGCINTTTVVVTVNSLPTITVSPIAICAGLSGTLTASGALTYSWAPATGLSATTGASVTANPAATTTYTVTGTSATGCVKTATVVVTVNPLPTVSAAPLTLCAGASGTLTASGASTYSWALASGLSATTGTSVTANPAATTTYTITGTSAAGCVNTTTVVVTVNPIPVTAVTSATVCPTQTATLTASGATTYSWTAGLSSTTGATVTGAPASTTSYTVTGTTLGCSSTAIATITIGGSITPTVNSPTICAGQTATLTAANATTFAWSAGLSSTTGATVTGSPVTTTSYTVTGTAAGCTGTAVATITVNPLPTITVSPIAICAGLSGTLTASGASTYSWAPATGLSATTGASVTANPATTTTYTVTGTSALGCVKTATVVVTVNPLPTVSAAPVTLCAGASGTLTASGASTYSWALASGLSATTGTSVTANPAATTTYTITGTSAAGCVNTGTVIVTVNPIPVTAVTSATVCPTQTATLTASGATTYSWTAGLSSTTGATVTGAPASTTSYTVTGTSLGCSSTAIATITIGGSITPTVNSPTICVGQTATLTAANATTFSWTAGLSSTTGATVTGSPATTTSYTVTGTAGGCTGTAVATITVNPLPTITASPIAICAGIPGTLTASGASTYSWAPSTGLSATTGASVTANPAATTIYTVTGTSVAGCVNTATVVVTVNPLPTVSCTPITICSGIAGTLTASGASTYTWAPATGLSATTGASVSANPAATTTYTITGTSAAGCVNTTTVIVTVNTLPVISVSPITICAGIAGTLTASGANTYSWSPATGLSATTGATVSANPAATTTYTVTGTAATGCINTATVTVTVTPAATLSIVKVNISCFGGTNGSATVTPVGGTTPYTYSWAPSGGTGATASSLSVGTYTVTVTTNNGCISTTTANITEPAGMTLTMSSVNATCGAANGQASVSVTGGSPGYTYSWAASGGTAATATGLTAATYTVTVTDLNGCISTNSVAVNNSGSPTASTTVISNVSCFGGNTGSASVTISGGSSPYTQVWSPSGGTGLTATGLTAGTYTVTVTDFAGCIVTANATITAPPVLTASTATTDVICFGGSTGTATVTAVGGSSPYTYSWAASGGTGITANGLPAGTYTVTVTDFNSCITTATATIAQPTVITGTTSNTPVSCFGGTNGTASVVAGGGMPGYTYSWASSGGSNATASGLPAGTYTVTITDLNGCIKTATTTISQPILLSVSTTFVNSSCGFANGSATATATGGTGVYTYSWAPSGGTSSVASGLAAATYTVTVTDANGCTATSSTTVSDLSGLVASITAQTNVSCFGASNGSVTVTASGSTGPYTYSIDAGVTFMGSGTFGTLAAGNYTIIAKDANGCTVTVTVTITQPPVLTASTVKTDVICFGGSTGTATVTAVGGSSPYTYSWAASGGTGITANGLPAGTYTVTVTDFNSCITTATATIAQPTVITGTTSNTPVSCFGGTNGTASVVAGGGMPGYTYSWAASGGSNATASGLGQGTYTVTITDLNGCIKTATTNISQPILLSVSTSFVNSSCGFANGSATATATGGTGVYTYSWAPSGGTSSVASGLAAATYTVTVTDANGCTATSSTTVNDLSGLVASITAQTNVSCFGASNGSVTVTGSGSTGPYTYSIDAGATFMGSGTFGTLAAGNYTIIAKDSNGCTVTVTVTITAPPVLTASTATTDVICFGGSTGTATVTAVGGSSPYTYSWAASGGTGITANGLPAGTYTVTVTDFNSCITTATATIAQPTVITGTTSNTAVSCFGGTNGTASVVAGGGMPGYTYSWASSGGSNATASGLPAGTYTVTITDLNGCIKTATTTISQPILLSVSTTFVNSSCGFANGSATATATGGTGVYTYSWAPSGGTSSVASGLAAATYTVTVTDANGCTATSSTTVSDLSGLVASITAQTNVSCFGGSNGSVTVTASGSSSPYTYSIDAGATFMGSGTFGTLAAGNYTIIAKDANGCTVTVIVTITEPTALTGGITAQTNVLCNGANTGSVTVLGAGGVTSYTYSLNAGAFVPSGVFSSLTAGNYTVTVKDNNACTVIVPVTITQPTALAASVSSQTNNICFAGTAGSVTIGASGGTSTYTYSLNGGPSQSSGTFTGMTVGSYTVTVTDANNCTTTVPVAITQPTQVTVSAIKADASCGAANGSITATGANGTSTYTYSINGTTFQAGSTFNGLIAATYTVTVKDANGCINTTSITINDLSGLVAPETHINVSCNGGSNGSITVTAGGSSAPYTYSIDGGITFQPSGTFSGLTQGSYTIIAMDGNSCTLSVPVTITQPALLTGTLVSQTNINCFGGTGSATVSAGGGTTAYSYSIDGGGYVAGTTFTGLAVGAHTITIKDANNCTTTVSVTITQPAALALTTSSTNATCTAANGTATVTASGGTTNYTYLWTPGGAITATASSITAGNYSVLVTDANGCTQTASVSVGANPGASATISSSTNVTCIGANDGTATVSMGAGSIPVFTYAWSPSPGGGQGTPTATGLAPSSYNVTVTDGYGCVGTTSVTITEPTQLSFSFITTPVKCFGGADGTATINPTGGSPGYTYLWTPGGYTTQAITSLAAGIYTCVFTDVNGCSKTATTTITEPLGMSLSETHIDANCSQSNGSATVSVTGGTGPYTYLWNDPGAQTTLTAAALASNTYAVTVTDANMCSQILSVTINNLSGPVASIFASNNVSCFGNNDGSATAQVTGGNNPYQFSWSNGQTLPTATNLIVGTYVLTATDMSGCIATISIAISEPTPLNTTYSSTNPTCFGLADGTITTNSTGGTAPYTYLWTPGGATTSSVSGLLAGSYFVTVSDAQSCTSTSTIVLSNPAQVTATVSSSNITCSGLCNGTATANPLIGNGPFTYLWNDPNAQTTAIATGLCGGSYTVTVTDVGGCSAAAFTTITSPNAMSINITALGNVSCFGACDGFAQAAVTGGSAPYSYLWMPGITAGSSVNNLCAATYTVTATDANGCTAFTTATITQPAALTASIISSDITCYQSCDGGATAVYQGGTGPYTFQWSPSLLTTPTIANICAGIQNLAVSDNNGCTAIASVVMIEPTILAVSTTTVNSNCGSADGSACAQITGGSPPFIYAWNDPMTQGVSCANNLNAGVYTISITDGHGCSVTNVANVNDNLAPVVTIPTSTDVTCFGAANGDAQASITGGILPYSIDWTPGVQNTAFVNNLSGGIYSIIVTDSVGCVGTNSVTINEPAVLVSGITASTNVSCTLSCDGSATVAAGGGTSPYTYLWNDAATQATTTATGLCAQQYNVTVTDSNGCTSSSIATIGQPTPITIQLISSTNVTCYGGNDGQITTSVSGGTPGYTYFWTPNVGSSAQVTNLMAGSYQLLVTDANGCTKTTTVDIQQPNAILITTNMVSSTCSLPNGAASVIVSGGISPYTYFWSPSGTASPVISLLASGTYSVTVTDDHGCIADTSVDVQNILGPTISNMTFTEPACNGTSLGTATAVATGGQPLYTYLWSGIGAQTTQTATALPVGTYQVTVSDANHCNVIGVVTITEPAPLVVVPAPRDTICIGELAQIYGAGYGGTPAYTYTYTPVMNPPGPPYTVNPVTTTIYTVYVTDANNCISPAQTISIFVRDSVRVTATDTAVCNGQFVPISATATGGTGGPYTYSWSNGINTQSQNVSPTINQSPSNYTVMASDGCSPVAIDISTVTVYPLAVSFMSVIDTAGCEDFTVQFTALSNIGTSYSWNFGDGSASQPGAIVTHTYVTPNSYNVSLTVTTIQGCVSTITNNQYIDVYPTPIAAFTANPNQATTTSPQIAFIDQSIGANTWAWDFGVPYFGSDTSTTQNPVYTYADSGSYNVQLIVTNNYGCADTISQPVYIIPEYVLYAPNAFTPFNHDGLNDTFMPQGVGIDPNNFEMWIFDRWGNLIYKTNDINKGWDGKANGGNKVAQSDSYVWKIATKDFRGDNHQYIGRVSLVR